MALMTVSSESVRRTIERQNTKAVSGYATGDVEALASIFAEDAWQMPPHQPALVGRSTISAFWRTAVQWGKWEFSLVVRSVDVSDPIAVERGSYNLKFTAGPGAPPGMNTFEDRGNYLVHWRHEPDDEWRIVADAPVSELPLPTPP